MNWELILRKKVKTIVKKFPKKDYEFIVESLREMRNNPYSGDILKLEGEENSWRRRSGAYRIFYNLYLDKKIIHVFRIERRTSKTY